MNMNTHINRQAEEADGCWPVTFALLNISTEGKLSPGSAARGSGELPGDEDFICLAIADARLTCL